MRSSRTALLPFFLCLSLQLAFGQQFWEKKLYTQWSDKEVKKMMQDSPWAQQFTVSSVQLGLTGPSYGGRGPSQAARDRGMEQNPRLVYTVQFRSAKPVRQALVRRVQIDKKYDEWDAARKAGSDRRAQEFLESPPNEIMVYVGFETNVPAYAIDVQRCFSSFPSGTVPADTFLNIGGAKLSPTSYQAVTGGVQLTFKRPANVPVNGEISLEFQSPQVGDLPAARVYVPFNLTKMSLGGGVEL